MSNFIRNEQQRLRATFFNNLGVAAFFAGVVAPLFHPGPLALSDILISWTAGMSLAASGHYVGIWILSGLEE